jgi:hypothetical protein
LSQFRTPTAYVLGVLVLLAVIVLTTPNGGTRARWSATAQAEVPVMTTGRVGFEIAGVESSATLTNTSGFGVRYRPLHVSLADSAGRSVAPPEGMRFAYRTGTACDDGAAPAEWTALAPGGSAPVGVDGGTRAPLEQDRSAGVCLTVSTDAVAEDALRPLGGQPLHVVTVVEAASLGDGTWSTTRSWTVPFTVEKPPVEQPPVTAPTLPVAQDAARCGADTIAAQLRWSWTGALGAPAVAEWHLLVRPRGSTVAPTPVKRLTDGTAREIRLSADELRGVAGHEKNQDYDVLVRAVLTGGATPHVDSAYAWTVRTAGASHNINCEGLPS